MANRFETIRQAFDTKVEAAKQRVDAFAQAHPRTAEHLRHLRDGAVGLFGQALAGSADLLQDFAAELVTDVPVLEKAVLGSHKIRKQFTPATEGSMKHRVQRGFHSFLDHVLPDAAPIPVVPNHQVEYIHNALSGVDHNGERLTPLESVIHLGIPLAQGLLGLTDRRTEQIHQFAHTHLSAFEQRVFDASQRRARAGARASISVA